MTEAQKDAREKVRLIMDEHFEAWVLVMLTENPENDKQDMFPMSYSGGSANALGLLRYATTDLERSAFTNTSETESE